MSFNIEKALYDEILLLNTAICLTTSILRQLGNLVELLITRKLGYPIEQLFFNNPSFTMSFGLSMCSRTLNLLKLLLNVQALW